MADWYVRSGATGTGTGANWANAQTTLAAAYSAGAAGDRFFVSEDHAESSATTITAICPGTPANPCVTLCVNHSGSVPPVSADLRTTATFTTTAAGASVQIEGTGYFYGLTLVAGSGAASAASSVLLGQQTGTATFSQVWENCFFHQANTNNGTISCWAAGSNNEAARIEWRNCTVEFAVNLGTGNLSVMGRFDWYGGSVSNAGVIPSPLIGNSSAGEPCFVKVRGADLSALGAGKSLVYLSPAQYSYFYLEDCKLGSSVSIASGSIPSSGGAEVVVVNCDSTATNYRYYKQNYEGTITQETTVVRSGGATDGTTPVSRKMVSTANSKFYTPLRSDPIIFWNDSTSAVTINLPVITDGVTLQNVDAWIEVEYLGSSASPQATFDVSSRASDVLASGSNQPTDSTSTWTTTGLTSPVKQTLSASITPGMKGPMQVRVMLARPSTTMWFDPQVI